MFRTRACRLRDATVAVNVSVCPVAEGLRQTSVQVHGEGGRVAVQGFAKSITQAVVKVGDIIPPSAQGLQTIGGIIGIRIYTIIEQVAIVVPGVGHTIEAGQAVGYVIVIICRGWYTTDETCLLVAVSDGIILLMVVIAVGVCLVVAVAVGI